MKNLFGPNRQSIRWRGYDYASAGAYFITICTHGRQRTFGEIKNGMMQLFPVGEMVQEAWKNIPQYDPYILLDEFIVMPDHMHAVVWMGWNLNDGQGWYPAPTISLSSVIGRFKSWTTHQYRRHLERNGLSAPLDTRLWQRNYHERVIRNDKELNATREYIFANPLNWKAP